MPASRPPTLYDLLQVRSDATTQDIRHAWRRLAQEHHPDRGASADGEAMTRINHAYEVLSDPDRRARYDQQLLAQRPPRRARWLQLLQQRAGWVTAAAVAATVVLAAGAWTVLGPRPGGLLSGAKVTPAPRALPAEPPLALTPAVRLERVPAPKAESPAGPVASRP